jgi:hypothetical protein
LAGSLKVSGYLNGPGPDARFSEPFDVAYADGKVFVADFQNHAVRCITDLNDGSSVATVNTVVGCALIEGAEYFGLEEKEYFGLATNRKSASGISGSDEGIKAKLRYPTGVAANQDSVYIADWGNHVIKKVPFPTDKKSSRDLSVTIVAGESGVFGETGASELNAQSARFKQPTKIAVDPLGNIFVSDSGNHAIKRIGIDEMLTLVAGVEGLPGNLNSDLPVEFYYQWYKGIRPIVGGSGNASTYEIKS